MIKCELVWDQDSYTDVMFLLCSVQKQHFIYFL